MTSISFPCADFPAGRRCWPIRRTASRSRTDGGRRGAKNLARSRGAAAPGAFAFVAVVLKGGLQSRQYLGGGFQQRLKPRLAHPPNVGAGMLDQFIELPPDVLAVDLGVGRIFILGLHGTPS